MKKRLLFFFVGLVCSLVANAADVADLVTINRNWTFIADDITSKGTKALSANTLYCDGFILANTGNTVSSGKGKSTFGGVDHLNSLRIKNTQDQLVFKVAGACKITFYTQSHASRGINAGTSSGGTDLGVQPNSTPVWELNISEATTIYLSSHEGDFYFAGFVISGMAAIDAAPEISVPSSYTGDIKHVIDVKASVYGSPEPTIQWYSNTIATNQGGKKIEGATNATYQFAPSEPGTYYFYATAENKMGNARSSVTKVTVTQAYQADFDKGEGVIGTAPAVVYTAADGKLTIPTNYSLFVEGKTLASWTDGVNNYEPGKQYTISSDIVLTPIFVENIKTLSNISEETTIKFIKTSSKAVTYESSEKNAIVESLSILGQKTDVALIVQNGKFDLQPSNPRAQTNNGTVISIPVTKGAIVKINIYDNKADGERTYTATINGEDIAPYLGAESNKQRMMTYMYNGEAGYIDYVVGAGNMYAYCIDVTYPDPTGAITIYDWSNHIGNYSIGDNNAVAEDNGKIKFTGSLNYSNPNKYIKISSVMGGFKAGDIVTFTGYYSNSAEKSSAITIFGGNNSGSEFEQLLEKSEQFANTHSSYQQTPTSQSFTLTYDVDVLYIGRNGGTTTYLSDLTVKRPLDLATVSVNSNVGYATFYSDMEGYVLNGKVYTATYNAKYSTITLAEIEDGIIPANTGVIIEGEGDVIVKRIDTGATFSGENDLQGTLEEIATSSITEGTVFVLGYVEGQTGFYEYTGTTLGANKAYLVLPTNAPAKINIVKEGDNVTGINAVNAQTVKNSVMYNLAGQRVNANAKGLVIMNGKVMIKK